MPNISKHEKVMPSDLSACTTTCEVSTQYECFVDVSGNLCYSYDEDDTDIDDSVEWSINDLCITGTGGLSLAEMVHFDLCTDDSSDDSSNLHVDIQTFGSGSGKGCVA